MLLTTVTNTLIFISINKRFKTMPMFFKMNGIDFKRNCYIYNIVNLGYWKMGMKMNMI